MSDAKERISIVLAGIGGYGGQYVEKLLQGMDSGSVSIAGVVDPKPWNSIHLDLIQSRGIPVYSDLEHFYSAATADLAIISSPIQYHGAQACTALSQGSHVLCEKPISATVEEALRMIGASKAANRFLAIGYQWSYSRGIFDLKKDIINGLFGKPKRFKTLALFPRTEAYFSREWAGKKRDAQGNWVLDSVANNATAHYIHNMFYVLGGQMDKSSVPIRVQAELYRAYAIENYDTAAMRAVTREGVELLYYGSHAVKKNTGLRLLYEFDNATISYEQTPDQYNSPNPIVALFHNGSRKEYANPNLEQDNKLWMSVAAVKGEDVVLCSAEAALSHTLCVNAMQLSVKDITDFPAHLIIQDDPLGEGEKRRYVEGIDEELRLCFERWMLPSECGFPWAEAGNEVLLEDHEL